MLTIVSSFLRSLRIRGTSKLEMLSVIFMFGIVRYLPVGGLEQELLLIVMSCVC